MAERLLLVNPSKPPSKRGQTKMAKGRTAAQKAATRKLVALNRARRAGSAAPKRMRNPIRAVVATPAPYRRPAGKLRSPVRRRRRNPIGGAAGKDAMTLITGAVPGAIGALALDAVWANLPLPAAIKTGYVGYAAKGAGAVLLALLARRVVKRSTADAFGTGALTVMLHGLGKSVISTAVPALNLGCDTGYAGMGYYPPPALGYYPPENLGYMNAAVNAGSPSEEMSFVR
ncbi:MAG: hypothetical protein AB7Q37_18750 [Pyrinomonadaceae bacterium]